MSADLVYRQFGALLAGLRLPESWREEVRQRILMGTEQAESDNLTIARERERLLLKRERILKQHREASIDEEAMRGEIAAVELALGQLRHASAEGLKLDEILAAGERLPGIAALWEIATQEEQRELVTLLLDVGGLYYDLECKMIAAIKPRSVWFSVLELAQQLEASHQIAGMLILTDWQQQERR